MEGTDICAEVFLREDPAMLSGQPGSGGGGEYEGFLRWLSQPFKGETGIN